MSTLVFIPNRNVKRADYSAVFRPEAERFLKSRGVAQDALQEVPLKAGAHEAAGPGLVLERIGAARKLDTLAFFCHGFPNRLQLGLNVRNLKRCAAVLAGVAQPNLRVILYACSAASAPGPSGASDALGGEGGFADTFRDALCEVGLADCQVDAHTTAGHATTNPFVRRFRGEGSPTGGQGGGWIVRPKQPRLWKAWVGALKKQRGTFRFEFPFLSVAEIHGALSGVA